MKKVIYSILFFSLSSNELASSSYNGVIPQDTPPILWEKFDSTITKLITSDYSALVSPWSDVRSIPDSDIKGIRQKVFGGSGNSLLTQEDISTYQDIFALPATLFDAMGASTIEGSNQNVIRSLYGGYNKNYKSVSGIFIGGTFVKDDNNIIKGIKSGEFNNINYIRLMLSEYLIGRLYIAALGFKNSPVLSTTYSDNISDLAIVNNFITKAETMLAQIRYVRSAFPIPDIFGQSSTGQSSSVTPVQKTSTLFGSSKQNTSSSTNSGSARMSLTSSTLRPIDTFAGIVLINKIPGVQLGTSTNPIPYQSAGFISSGEFINNWQNLNVDTSNNWYIQRGLRYGGEGAAGAAYLYISQKVSGLVFNTDYSPQDFFMMDQNVPSSVQAFEAFFRETTPWAFVILCEPGEMVNGQSTTVNCQTLGLIKLNPLLFATTPFTPNAIRKNGLMMINGNTNNGNLALNNGKVGDSYELTDLWYAPQNLYNETFPNSFTDGSPYPYAYLFLQSLYNGYLQTSSYQALVESGSVVLADSSNPNNNVNEAIYAQNRWNTPTVEQWLSSDSYLDWKFLRALLVTYYAGALIYVRESAFRYNEAKKMTYLEEIFMNPESDIDGIFIGNSSDFKYISVLPYPFAVIPNAIKAIQTFVSSIDVAKSNLESVKSLISNLTEIQSFMADANQLSSESKAVLKNAESVSTKVNAQNIVTNAQVILGKLENLQVKIQALQIPSNLNEALQKVQESITSADQNLQNAETKLAALTSKDKTTNQSIMGNIVKMTDGKTKIEQIKNEINQISNTVGSLDQIKKILTESLEISRNALSTAQQKEMSLSNSAGSSVQQDATSTAPKNIVSDPLLAAPATVAKEPLTNQSSSQAASNTTSSSQNSSISNSNSSVGSSVQQDATSTVPKNIVSDPLLEAPATVVKEPLTNQSSSQAASNTTSSSQNSSINTVGTSSSGMNTTQKTSTSTIGAIVPKFILSSSKKK